MNVQVSVALIAAAAAAIGWLVTHVLSQLREERKARAEATVRHVERQLEELYGPLVALIYEGRQVFEDLLVSLGRNYVFLTDQPLPREELDTWLYWAENQFLPRNERIRELLTSKSHLVEGECFPESYVTFFKHESSWAVRHGRWLKDQVAYDWHSRINWPIEFERDVVTTFEALKAKHARLLGVLQ